MTLKSCLYNLLLPSWMRGMQVILSSYNTTPLDGRRCWSQFLILTCQLVHLFNWLPRYQNNWSCNSCCFLLDIQLRLPKMHSAPFAFAIIFSRQMTDVAQVMVILLTLSFMGMAPCLSPTVLMKSKLRIFCKSESRFGSCHPTFTGLWQQRLAVHHRRHKPLS